MNCNTPVQVAGTTMTYGQLVEKLKKSLPYEMDLMHMAMGIAGEAGEVVDAIKKHVIYGKGINLPNVIEELGDLQFYTQGLMQILAISEHQVLQQNATKLGEKRYPNGYTDAAAVARADKAADQISG